MSRANSILGQPRSSKSSNSRSHSLRWAPDDPVPSESTQAAIHRIHLSDVDKTSSGAENQHDIQDSGLPAQQATVEDLSVIGNGTLNHAERRPSTPIEHVEQNRSARKRTRLGYLGKRATFVVRKASTLMRKVRFLTSRKPVSRRTSLVSRRSTSTLNIVRTRIDQTRNMTLMAPDSTQNSLQQSNVSLVPSNLERPVVYQAAPLSGQDVTTLGSDNPATVTTVPAKEAARRQKRRELSHRARLRDLQIRSCPCAPMCDCHPIYGLPRPIRRSQTNPLNPLVSVPSVGEVLRTVPLSRFATARSHCAWSPNWYQSAKGYRLFTSHIAGERFHRQLRQPQKSTLKAIVCPPVRHAKVALQPRIGLRIKLPHRLQAGHSHHSWIPKSMATWLKVIMSMQTVRQHSGRYTARMKCCQVRLYLTLTRQLC